MLYYDRRLAAELLSLLSDGAPLSWLVAHSRADAQTRLEFRRAEGERRYGAIQLYRGRTSPVEVLGLAKGQVKLKAHRTYQALMPGLFGPAIGPKNLQAALGPYLKLVADIAPDAFTGGEGAVHNALMRRYSLLHTDRDPVLLVDSEVRVGFRQDSRHRTGTEHRVAHQRQMERELRPVPPKRLGLGGGPRRRKEVRDRSWITWASCRCNSCPLGARVKHFPHLGD